MINFNNLINLFESNNYDNPIQSAQFAHDNSYIAYPLRASITQIEPRLDMFWQEYLLNIFQNTSNNDRKNVMEQLLQPKEIFWNKEQKTFEYRGVHQPFVQWVKTIPSGYKSLKILAVKLVESLNSFKTYQKIDEVGDYLENIFIQINNVDVKNSLGQQITKQKLLAEFTYAVAEIIRQHSHWDITKNYRGLSLPILKSYICEVFLKQQLLSYWFKTLRNRQLAEMAQPLLNDFLCREQRVRQLQVVRASKYIFAIAPTVEFSSNAFGINRFMLEERLCSGGKLLFNGAVINTALLAQYDEEYQNRFKKQIDHIITIESNVSRAIIDLVNNLEVFHDNQLVPMLFSCLDTSQSNLIEAIQKRLAQYEQLLSEHILLPLRHALIHTVKNSDEHEYLYIGMRQLFGSIISVFRDFQTQPALLLNIDADAFFGRLVAYATFLEKRREHIFVMQSSADWKASHEQLKQPLATVHKTASSQIMTYRRLHKQIEQQTLALEKPETFFDKLFKKREKQAEKLADTKVKYRAIGYEVHKKLLHLNQDFGDEIVYLEFDSQLITDESLRHYAFPTGDNGITKLPIILTLPENRLNFNYEEFITQLSIKTDFALNE